jgi:hypothetical protein
MNSKDVILEKLAILIDFICSISLLNRMFMIFCILLLTSGCLTKSYDYGCGVWIVNNTNDTLYMKIGRTSINTIMSPTQFVIFPHDTLDHSEDMLGGMKINEGMNPAEYFLNEKPLLDTVLVQKNGILKAAWYYPAKSAPISDHSFFNYNSWNLVKIDKYNAAIIFTIFESDLVLNN